MCCQSNKAGRRILENGFFTKERCFHVVRGMKTKFQACKVTGIPLVVWMESAFRQIGERVGKDLLVNRLNLALRDLSEVYILVAVEIIVEASKDLVIKLGGFPCRVVVRPAVTVGDDEGWRSMVSCLASPAVAFLSTVGVTQSHVNGIWESEIQNLNFQTFGGNKRVVV